MNRSWHCLGGSSLVRKRNWPQNHYATKRRPCTTTLKMNLLSSLAMSLLFHLLFSLCPCLLSLSLSVSVSVWCCGGVVVRMLDLQLPIRTRHQMASGPPGLHTTTGELQTCTFQGPGASNTTKIPRKDPQERERQKIVAGEGKKSAKLWASTLLGPTLRGPPFVVPKFNIQLAEVEIGRNRSRSLWWCGVVWCVVLCCVVVCCCVVLWHAEQPRVSTQHVSVCTFKTSPCSGTTRTHVSTCASQTSVSFSERINLWRRFLMTFSTYS